MSAGIRSRWRSCELFESLGFQQVETFIASGNVIFTDKSKSTAMLEKKIEACLEKALGYEVKTFIRTDAEVAAITRAALLRKESRGAQFREDFPTKDPEWGKYNIVIKRDAGDQMLVEKREVAPMPEELKAVIEEMK